MNLMIDLISITADHQNSCFPASINPAVRLLTVSASFYIIDLPLPCSPPIRSTVPSSREVNRMPSLQTALPPELANNAIRLYRECLRRAKYIGHKQHNTELVVQMVRQQFRKHLHETDPEKILKLKDDAARGLINHILYEAEEMTGRKFS
ncbi:hypothetical protein L6452_18836 [Arctium lappa]|uniref:Uncharacterized protein n=1 Tax=Arctium lappa TaxID=4217 RepID=A0ACB9C7I4_ARCLA|nr:hypothetical protein L6452_18836 [Arctium lappa]